ncbi:hypothetical protein BH10BAC5_BH10BAC5_09860 [soil metagenome]
MKISIIFICLSFLFFVDLSSQPVWTQQYSGSTTFNSISSVDNSNAWAIGNISILTGKIFRTTNSGNEWFEPHPASMQLTNGFCAINQDIALYYLRASHWSTGEITFIYKTIDGGISWNTASIVSGRVYGMQVSDIDNIFLCSVSINGTWRILKSNNIGETWSGDGIMQPPGGVNNYGYDNCFCIKDSNMWFGTWQSNIYHSSDLGLNWNQQTIAYDCSAIWFNSTTSGLAGGTSLYFTSNGGLNWTIKPIEGATGRITGITGKDEYYWVTYGNKVYKSVDNGEHWIVDYIIPGQFYGLVLAKLGGSINGNIWAISESGIHKYGLTTGIGPIQNTSVTTYTLKQNFPNPFNPQTSISFSIPKYEFTTLKVFSLGGKEVASLVNEELKTGNYSVSFNGSALPSGIYFYQLRSGDFTSSKKMTLIK